MKDNVCEGVIVESVNGREIFGAKVVVDTMGDASIMYRAGVPTVVEENYITYISHYCYVEMVENLREDQGF